MRTTELIDQLGKTMALLTESNDELRDLDQVLGDGDLGVTVTAGAKAIIEALESTADDATAADVARACAKAFANANPSTMAALVAGGLLAGSKTLASVDDISKDDAVTFIRTAAESISQRGKSQVGDKTILDAIVPAYEAMDGAGAEDAVDAAITAAADNVVKTRDLQSRRGRASWLQDRSIGLQDPGATAFLRLLEAWRDASAGERGPKAAVVD